MQIAAKLDRPKVRFDKETQVNLMVSLTAPDIKADKKRNPLAIAAVLDRSGSMGEADGSKIINLRKTMYKLIDNLSEDDSLALVFFDDVISFVGFEKMTSSNKERFKKEIAQVNPRGNTDIGSAICKASELFTKFEGPAGSLERVLLLTDGEANTGATSPEQFIPLMKGLRKGVTMSTFGYGERYNETLLASLSKEGKGSNYFIENPDAVAKAFGTELGSLLICFAQEIKLRILPHQGSKVVNVLNDFDVASDTNDHGDLVTSVDAGDIYHGETKHILVRLETKKLGKPLPREMTVADVDISYRNLDDGKTETSLIKPKIEFVKTDNDATKEADKEITSQVALLEAALMQEEAKRLADSGQWQQAKQVLYTAEQHVWNYGGGTPAAMAYTASLHEDGDMMAADYDPDSVVSKKMSSTANYVRRSARGATGASTAANNVVGAFSASNMSSTSNDAIKGVVNSFTGQTGDSNAAQQQPEPKKPSGYNKNRKTK